MQTQKPTRKTSAHSEVADSVLVQQALAGDHEAFETLVHRYETALFQMIYRYVGEYHEAWDVLQQVLLQLYLSLASLHVQAEIRPWLFTVARNRCIDRSPASQTSDVFFRVRAERQCPGRDNRFGGSPRYESPARRIDRATGVTAVCLPGNRSHTHPIPPGRLAPLRR